MSAPVPAPALAPELAELLAAANVTRGGLMVALGGEPATDPAATAVADRALGDDRQAVLARLFVFGLAVSEEHAAGALEPLTIAALAEDGWLAVDDGRVRSQMAITPFEDLLLAHDRAGIEGGADVVPGMSDSAETLAALVPRRPVGSALDVGTGCGVHALLAARHAERVVATDVNPRALAFARLSAALSGVDGVEFLEGSLFEPVAGERFDLVVSNPPYVISPDLALTYRDGTLGGDDMSRTATEGTAAALAPGGVGVLLVNWIHYPFESWAATPRAWLDGGGCDALLLHQVTETPLAYAARWNASLAADPAAYAGALDSWTAYFAEAGIASLATGAVVLRRTARATPLVTEHEMIMAPRGEAGAHALRLLDAAEWLAETSDELLLRTPLRLAEHHTLVSERVRRGAAYEEDTVRLALTDSVGLDETVGPGATSVLVGLDAGATPADAIPGLAAAVDTHHVTIDQLVAELTRGLVARGVVVRD